MWIALPPLVISRLSHTRGSAISGLPPNLVGRLSSISRAYLWLLDIIWLSVRPQTGKERREIQGSGARATETGIRLDFPVTLISSLADVPTIIDNDHDTLFEKLWARMNQRGEFPLLSNSLRATVSAMKNDDGDFTALVQVVLSDFTLTQKVIRLANSAMYISFGRNTTTVSRALMILGMEVVGHLVIGLKLVDHFHQALPKMAQIDAKLELNRVMLASYVARQLTEQGDRRSSEQAVVCTLMRQLGRLLCLFYLDQEWQQIHQLAEREGRSEDDVCGEVLGVSFEELGLEAAARWGLPKVIHDGMRRFDPRNQDDGTPEEVHWLRAVTGFSSEVSSLMSLARDDPRASSQHLLQLAAKYSAALKLDLEALLKIPADLAQEGASTHYMKEIASLRARTNEVRIHDAERHLRECVQELRTLPAENRVPQVLTMALETMLSSLNFSRVIAFVRDARTGYFVARLGLGPAIESLLPELYFDEAFAADVFHLAIINSVGIFIENSRAANFSAHIPAWFRSALPDAEGFVLVPVRSHAGAVSLLYGDWNTLAHVRKIMPSEMSVLNELARELGRFF